MELYPSNLPGLTFDGKKTPTYRTGISEASAGNQYRVGYYKNPLWQWHLEYEMLRDQGYRGDGFPFDELNILRGFFMARRGSLEDFLYRDPDDNTVTDGQLLMLDSGSGWVSPIQATIGASLGIPAFFDITDLIPTEAPDGSDILVNDNGTAQVLGTDYTLDQSVVGGAIPIVDVIGNVVAASAWDGLAINWLHPPTGPVTASFQYYFRCHFASYSGAQRSQSGILDALELNNFLNKLWEAKTVEFESSR